MISRKLIMECALDRESDRFSIFSMIIIILGTMVDELSTRIALTHFPHRIFECNKLTILLMNNDLWLAFDIIVIIVVWAISTMLFELAARKTGYNFTAGWIVGSSLAVVYGGFRLFAGVHNIQLMLSYIT